MASRDPASAATYQFGDSDVAAERLRRLAEVFEAASRRFLGSLGAAGIDSIADLGCGPGYTTNLLAEVFPAARVTGFDNSAHFVSLARRAATEQVCFEVADVTQPLPGGPYDLIYCRYLLTHVAQPKAAIDRWSGHLRPGGLIAIEENDWIRTEQPAFAQYLRIVERMLADAGQQLYVGAWLERAGQWPGLVRRASTLYPLAVSDRAAARMFLPNLQTWRSRPFVAENYPESELEQLRADLEHLAGRGTQSGAITFGLRRIVLARGD